MAGRFDRIHAMSILFAVGLTAFLAIEPTQNWLLLLLSILVGLGTDGVVRTHPRARFQRLDDTALFLFVPALFTLGLGLFLEEVAGGHLTILAGLLLAIPYWIIISAEYECVDQRSPDFQVTGLVLNAPTHVTAFLFFATIFDFELSLVTSSLAAGVVRIFLAVGGLTEEGVGAG